MEFFWLFTSFVLLSIGMVHVVKVSKASINFIKKREESDWKLACSNATKVVFFMGLASINLY